jgi:hypothetical protein
MRYAQHFGSRYGAPDRMVEYLVPTLAGDGSYCSVAFKPRAGHGDAYFALYADARKVAHRWCAEGLEQTISFSLPWGSGSSSFLALRLSPRLSNPNYDAVRIARGYDEADSRRCTLTLAFAPEVLGTGGSDGGYCSAWSLTGLDYHTHVAPLAGQPQPTRAYLDLALTVAGANVTVTLARLGVVQASGTGALGESVTLAEQNSSGLSGSVTVAPGAATTPDARLYLRWTAANAIERNGLVVAQVPFVGEDAALWTEPEELAPDTYVYRVRQVTDTDEEGAWSDSLTLSVPTVPEAPTELEYASGDAAATTLEFLGSITPGSVDYAAYWQALGAEFLDADNPVATTVAPAAWQALHSGALGDFAAPATPNGYRYECTGAGQTGATEPAWPTTPGATVADGTVTWTCRKYALALPAISGYPGTVRLIVRATLGTVEEQNLAVLDLEYDAAGDFVPARPNGAALDLPATEGLTFRCTYDRANEASAAVAVNLYAKDPGGSYALVGTGTLEEIGNGICIAWVNGSALADAGWQYLQARAADEDGIMSDPRTCPEYEYFCGSVGVPAAPELEGFVSRG